MFVMGTFEVLIIALRYGRVNHLAVMDSICLVVILHPLFCKDAFGKELFYGIFPDIVFTVKQLASSHIIAGKIALCIVLMAHGLRALRDIPAAL